MRRVLSVDVGIKNLALCLLEEKAAPAPAAPATATAPAAPAAHATATAPAAHVVRWQEPAIVRWQVLNLCGEEPKCGICAKKGVFQTPALTMTFCAKHAKISPYIVPTPAFKLASKALKSQSLEKLLALMGTYNIPCQVQAQQGQQAQAQAQAPAQQAQAQSQGKAAALLSIQHFFQEKVLQPVTGVKANTLDLVQIGVILTEELDKNFHDVLASLDVVVIENQISPIANRMKTLQGMLAQYFIMRGLRHIKFISAANKLKEFQHPVAAAAPALAALAFAAPALAAAPVALAAPAPANAKVKTTYAERKTMGIEVTQRLLANTPWLDYFTHHKKKDDLADSFLQGRWFLKQTLAQL